MAQQVITDKSRLWIQRGIILALGFIAIRSAYLFIRKKQLLRSFGNKETITNDKLGNTDGFFTKGQIVGFNAEPHARNLYNAMETNCFLIFGCTNEQLIWQTLDPLSVEQREAVRNYFNTHYGGNKGLMEWFEADLSGQDLAKAKGYFLVVQN